MYEQEKQNILKEHQTLIKEKTQVKEDNEMQQSSPPWENEEPS